MIAEHFLSIGMPLHVTQLRPECSWSHGCVMRNGSPRILLLAQERLHREWYEITGGSGRAEDALFAQGMRSRRMFENIDKLEHRLTKYEKKEQEKMLVAKEVGVHLEAARAGLQSVLHKLCDAVFPQRVRTNEIRRRALRGDVAESGPTSSSGGGGGRATLVGGAAGRHRAEFEADEALRKVCEMMGSESADSASALHLRRLAEVNRPSPVRKRAS